MTLSICIVNWNTRDLLKACLHSIERYPPAEPYEVIVVDNASTDGSAEMVRTQFEWVKLIANSENRGYAGGNNQAITQAQGEFILLLNPDTEIHPETFSQALAFMRRHPDVGAIGAKQVFPDGRIQPSLRAFPTPRPLLFEVLGLAKLFPKCPMFAAYRYGWFGYDRPIEVDQPMGTFLLVCRAVVARVGLMDESFPLFFNDVDWCYRIKQAGWKIMFVPSVVITHHGGASTSQVRLEAIRESHQALERFYEKHYRSRLPAPLYWAIIGLIRVGGWVRMKWARRRGRSHGSCASNRLTAL